jgi:D-alanyl-lipoteichoic acid acyltransferase DltB (MBOAT superfamily)
VRITKLTAIVSLYRYKERMNGYVLLTLYSVHVYLALELVLAAVSHALVGLELEPRFDRPYLSALLRDFWGRRWNLSVLALLRQCVFHPVRGPPPLRHHARPVQREEHGGLPRGRQQRDIGEHGLVHHAGDDERG